MTVLTQDDSTTPRAFLARRAPAALKTLERRQPLYFEGDARTSIYIVELGCLKLYRTLVDGQRQVVGFATPGDVIGLEAEDCYVNAAEAVCPSTVRAIPAAQLSGLLRLDPDFSERVLRQIGRQLAAAQAQLARVGAQNADQRLAGFLMSMTEALDDAHDEFDLPMRRGDIAEFLGLRLETVSRKFSEFQRRGWVRFSSLYRCAVRRPDILAQLAEGGEGPIARAA